MLGKPVELERPFKDAISRIRFAPSTSNLLISSWDSVLRLYDADASKTRLEAATEAPLLDCCFLGESVALSAGVDSRIWRYDLHSGKQETMGTHDDAVTSIEYSEETGQLVSTGLDKKLLLWDVHAMNKRSGYLQMDSEVTSMSQCGYCIIVAVGTHSDVYDLRNLKGPLRSWRSSMDHAIFCVRSLSKKQGFVIGSVDGRVALKFLEASGSSEMGMLYGRCVFHCHPKLKDRRQHLVSINDITPHPRHDTFVTGDNEGYTIVWDAQSKKRIFEFPRHTDSVASLSYNHSGQRLAIACSYTYQDVNEMEQAPQIFVHEVDNRGIPFSK